MLTYAYKLDVDDYDYGDDDGLLSYMKFYISTCRLVPVTYATNQLAERAMSANNDNNLLFHEIATQHTHTHTHTHIDITNYK
jgi:hypothetical protein